MPKRDIDELKRLIAERKAILHRYTTFIVDIVADHGVDTQTVPAGDNDFLTTRLIENFGGFNLQVTTTNNNPTIEITLFWLTPPPAGSPMDIVFQTRGKKLPIDFEDEACRVTRFTTLIDWQTAFEAVIARTAEILQQKAAAAARAREQFEYDCITREAKRLGIEC